MPSVLTWRRDKAERRGNHQRQQRQQMAASISAVESICLCLCQDYHLWYRLFPRLPTGQNKTPGATLCSQRH